MADQLTELASRRETWSPPPRPEWVRRINEEGAYMDIRGIVPLDEDSLIATATANTGLDDFGEDDWRDPFRVLIKALDEESELNLMGRIMTRSDLLMFLQARLGIEDAYKAHPEIDDEEISNYVIIVGQGRSGTSALQNLLSADPNNGTVTNWEALFPCPPPEQATYESDPRIERADRLVTQWHRVTPEIESMHEFAGALPTENIHLQCLGFVSQAWMDSFLGQVPSYGAYMYQRDPADAYRYEKRVLKLLQWRNPRRTWIMKSPFALTHLPSVLEVYPDAGFVWPHRDPVKALASVVNLIGTLHWMRTDQPFIGDTLAQYTNAALNAGMMSQPITWIERGALPAERLCNVQYADFVKDPMAVVEDIYSTLSLELEPASREAMQRYLDENPRSARPAHEYDLGSEELRAAERELFKPYQEYFHVPDEI